MLLLKEILCSENQFLLQQDIKIIKVWMCPELTVKRILEYFNEHKKIIHYLSKLEETSSQYMERDFLF